MSVDCHVCSCRVSVQHDALRTDAELQLALYAEQSKPTRVLTEVTLTPAEGGTRQTGPEIYYPAHGESLWDVAKRYALSPEDLAAANGLAVQAPAAEDSLSGAKFLLIP